MLVTHKTWQEKLKKGKGILVIMMLIIALGLSSCTFAHTAPAPNPSSITYKDITANEAWQLTREDSNLIILDVRTQSEYDSGHIPNAVWIPLAELVNRLEELDNTKTLLVYCQSEGPSTQACQVLIDNGYLQVYNLEGGIIAWQEAGAAVNHPPIVKSLIADDDELTSSDSCSIECHAEDPDGDSLSYSWSASEGDISEENSVATWTAPDELGTYTITVIVTDGRGGKSEDSLSISVKGNHRPIIDELIITPERAKDFNLKEMKVYKGASCEIECVASDRDEDKLRYKWSAYSEVWDDEGKISGKGFVVTWTAPSEKDDRVIITVTVSDGRGGKDTESLDFKVVTCRCML